MKTYRRHHCSRAHRTAETFLRCAIRGTAWIEGDGEFALVAWCRQPTITLFGDPAGAETQLRTLNATGCGGRCIARHEVIAVWLEPSVVTA